MPTERTPAFATLGEDIKQAREILNMSRKQLAEMANIDPRYLANIENSGFIPSMALLHQIVVIIKIPMEKYFNPELAGGGSEQRRRIANKLKMCPENVLPIIEGALDKAIQLTEKGMDNE